MGMKTLDERCINTIRFLAVDAVEKAHSGHPGLPLGAAPMAYVLWDRFLRHNPRNPSWFNRDRFILSAGHGSAMLYALLHLYGYDLPLAELKRFRQWGSKTPGHPEYGHTPGVEVTTGPLGQGFSMGVGMAIAERFLAHCFNTSRFNVVDHYTYIIASDGDMMEGVSAEAASLAGTLGLGKLTVLYDDNHISIEGDTKIAFTEDVQRRFKAYDWQVLKVGDGNDLTAVDSAIREAQREHNRPSIIVVRTHIGFGSPKQDTAAVHGEPLGAEAVRKTKEALDWPLEPTFYIPEDVQNHCGRVTERGLELEREWKKRLEGYRREHPDLAMKLEQFTSGELAREGRINVPVFQSEDGPIATRSASGKVMNVIAEQLPQFIGGSADLAPSNKTLLEGYGDFGRDKACARNLHFGVREHAMGAIINGIALHGGVIPYGATFLVFSDYMRPALRLAAMMQAPSTFVFTHDSIAIGEDGPTHQPVEHLMGLRVIPGLTVIRPADANEVAAAWRIAVGHQGPVAVVLTRQKLPVLDLNKYPVAEGVPRGAYILAEAEGGSPEIILIATGSEVHLALEVREILKARSIRARVVSMPSWELFDEQPPDYREAVLPAAVPRLAVEAGTSVGWGDYVGERGDVIGLARFGTSAPGQVALEKLGFSVDNVVEKAIALLER
jgi:transketolase